MIILKFLGFAILYFILYVIIFYLYIVLLRYIEFSKRNDKHENAKEFEKIIKE